MTGDRRPPTAVSQYHPVTLMDSLLFGLSLGFVSGISPGPLMTLVLTSTLERGFRAGVLTAIAPLLTDAPIILLSFLVLRQLPESFLSGLTVAGGVFVVWIGVQTIRDAGKTQESDAPPAASRDLLRGALVNVLSPHPWLFWVTVGVPFLIQSWNEAPWQAMAFLSSFLGLLVSTKIAVAWATAHGRRLLTSRWYRRVLVACGILLIGLGTGLVWRGLAR